MSQAIDYSYLEPKECNVKQISLWGASHNWNITNGIDICSMPWIGGGFYTFHDSQSLPFFPYLGLQLDENLERMQEGTMMRKVKSKNWKKQRYFMLKEDCMTIWYKSKMSGKAKSACEFVSLISTLSKQNSFLVVPTTCLHKQATI